MSWIDLDEIDENEPDLAEGIKQAAQAILDGIRRMDAALVEAASKDVLTDRGLQEAEDLTAALAALRFRLLGLAAGPHQE